MKVEVKTTPLYRLPTAMTYRLFSENYPVKKSSENSLTLHSKSYLLLKMGKLIIRPETVSEN